MYTSIDVHFSLQMIFQIHIVHTAVLNVHATFIFFSNTTYYGPSKYTLALQFQTFNELCNSEGVKKKKDRCFSNVNASIVFKLLNFTECCLENCILYVPCPSENVEFAFNK
ncbi:unnamed protein product [Owenia fusiformis]|uniref:Uncharacterized protein n=1 Tax=Owenia fusiformis TaxID=6347 RepID=A0A8S4PRT6_OWEFU|nr:unnamed protein product [Owenia fusiformis]